MQGIPKKKAHLSPIALIFLVISSIALWSSGAVSEIRELSFLPKNRSGTVIKHYLLKVTSRDPIFSSRLRWRVVRAEEKREDKMS